MNKFSNLLVVSLLSGTITLGAYKLFFDENPGAKSNLSIASDNYARNVSLGAENVDFTTRQARRFMQVSRELPNRTTSAHLTISKAFEILTLPEEAREEFIATNDVEDMTTRELREAIRKQKLLETEIEVLKKVTEGK